MTNPPMARASLLLTKFAFWRTAAIIAAALLAGGSQAQAQLGGLGAGIPSPSFQLGNAALADGRYQDALGIFRQELGLAHRVGQARWIDSICYYAMIGESEYRLGNLTLALQNFDAALQLYNQYPDWMVRIDFSRVPQVQAANRVIAAPWGQSNRGSRVGSYADNLPIQVGSMAGVQAAVQQGGALVQPRSYSVSPQEIVRCICIAIKRRRDILGPLITHDPLTAEVMATTARRLGPPNHWTEVWLDALQGMSYSVAGGPRAQQADGMLKRSLIAMGQYDHPLTALALLELGQMAMQSNDFKTAAGYFEEATYSAVQFSDSLVLEEAFRNLHLAYLLSGDSASMAPTLAAATSWAKNNGRELYASLLLLSAETMAVAGQTPKAMALLTEVRNSIGRREMYATAIGGRLNYLTALTNYQRAAMPAGDEALALALKWQRSGGSKWLFQIDYADKLCVANPGGRFSTRVALNLYDQLLGDPGRFDWASRPEESLAVLTTPHPLPFEHWLEAAVQADPDLALDIADLARRHRFFSTLHLGGRTLALRWVLESPEESLPNSARLQRQDLLVRYPKYAEAARKAKQLRAQIGVKGLSADADPSVQREAANKLNELAAIAVSQELILREIALRREAADMIFPPMRRIKDVQKALTPGQAVLAFFNTSHGMYAWLYIGDKYEHWRIENPGLVEKRTVALLRSLGNYDGVRELQEDQLTATAWKAAAKDLSDAIFGTKIKLNDQLQELIVVPDGVLWYVPFELLPKGSEAKPLIASSRVRNVPTLGLSLAERQGKKLTPDYGVATAKPRPNESEEAATEAVAGIQRVAPGALALRNGWTTPSPILGSMLDGLIVLEDIPASKEFYDWTPLPIDRSRNAGNLSAWLSLPWKQVDQYILPGFHSAAENSLKQLPAIPGADLFLSTTALMATGARTVLISRWRTGGQTASELVREFVQELPFVPADESWQRAVQLLWGFPLDAEREPRVRSFKNGATIKADNPFFWAGYLLVDTGAVPQQADNPPAQPMIKARDNAANGAKK